MRFDAKNGLGYQSIYQIWATKLKEIDLLRQGKLLGFNFRAEQNCLELYFLGCHYFVGAKEGVLASDGKDVSVHIKSVIAHYVCSQGKADLSGKFLPLSRLTGMVEGQKSLSPGNSQLLTCFADNYDLFADIAKETGGLLIHHDENVGEYHWLFNLFPKVILKVIFQKAEEDFPAEIKMFFDEVALDYMEFEALGFLHGIFIDTFLQKANFK